MSSQAKVVVRVLGEELEKFEADNICLRRTNIKRMGGQVGHRSEFTEWFDVPYVSTVEDGRTLSNFNELTALAVPHRVNVFANVKFKLVNSDTLDQSELQRKMRSAMQALDNRINRAVANAVINQGSQFVSTTAASFSGFSDVASVNARFTEQDVSQVTAKTMILNPTDYLAGAENLQVASRSINKDSISETAYEEAKIAQIANFLTFQTSFAPSKAAAALASTTVTGAQSFIPVGSTVDANGDPTNVDNRTMNLIVASTAGVVPGDKFTIAGVNAVSMQNKNDTSKLRTFVVTGVVDGTNMTISPPIIPVTASPTTTATQAQADYANVSAVAANLAAVTFINFDTAQTNLFWENDAISINVAPVVGSDEDLGGMILMNETTELGLNVVVAKQGAIADLSTEWRVTTFFGVTIRDPLKVGTYEVGQTP